MKWPSTIWFFWAAAGCANGKEIGPVIEWHDIRATLNSKKRLLDVHHGRAEPGRLHAVMGPSGAGKTTLVNAIAGRLDASRKVDLRGDVFIDGLRSDEGALNTRAAYVTQQVCLFFHDFLKMTLPASMWRIPKQILFFFLHQMVQ